MAETTEPVTKADFTLHVKECGKCSLFPMKLCKIGSKLLLSIPTQPPGSNG